MYSGVYGVCFYAVAVSRGFRWWVDLTSHSLLTTHLSFLHLHSSPDVELMDDDDFTFISND